MYRLKDMEFRSLKLSLNYIKRCGKILLFEMDSVVKIRKYSIYKSYMTCPDMKHWIKINEWNTKIAIESKIYRSIITERLWNEQTRWTDTTFV